MIKTKTNTTQKKLFIKSLTKQNLTDFLHNLYVPENITIAMAGGATHQQMLELVTQYFAAMPAKSAPALQPAKFTANEVSIAKSLEQNYLVTGVEAYHFNHADYFAQQIMSQILGGGMSSRLFQKIREDSGLCYSIYSSSWGFDDTGLMFIYAAASQANIDIVKDLINKEIFDIIANVSQPELNRACAQIKAAQLMSLESPVSRSEQIARQSIFYKQLIKIDDIIEKLEAVTVADIKRVANDIFIKSGAQLNADGKFQLSDLTPSITINLGEAVDV